MITDTRPAGWQMPRALWQWTRRGLYWTLPPLLLYLVFRRVDLEQLWTLVTNADMRLVWAGVLLGVVPVVIAALRWHLLLQRYLGGSLSFIARVGEYWKSVAVGVLVPGSLGSDAYRVMVAGRESGRYLGATFVVAVEKLAALVSCAILVAVLYPVLASYHLPTSIVGAVRGLYAVLLGGAVLIVAVVLLRQRTWSQRLAASFDRWVGSLARKVAPRASALAPAGAPPQRPPASSVGLLVSVLSPAVGIPAVLLSLAVQFVSAAQVQLYYQGIGHGLPYSVNLFVSPLLFLLGTLPISFGGIGVREGASVMLYGAFGVPAETALAVSFCSTFGILVRHAVGAVLFLPERRRLRDGRRGSPRGVSLDSSRG